MPTPNRSLTQGGFASLLMAAIVAGRTTVDPDLWGHLRFGQDTLRTLTLVSVDPYSFTQDRPWINHEWLSEVLLAVAARGEIAGVLAMKGLIVVGMLALFWRLSPDVPEPYRSRLLAAGIISTAPIAVAIRPQLWTGLGVALVCWCLVRRRYWLLVPLFAVWANLHGGWIVGVGIVGLFMVGHLLDTRAFRASLELGAVLALSVAATLVTPYGWHLWEFLLNTVGGMRETQEWRPLWEQANAPAYLLLWMIPALGTVGCTLAYATTLPRWALWLPAMALGAMSIFVARLLPFFAIVATVAALRTWAVHGAAPAPVPARIRRIQVASIALLVALQFGVNRQCLPVSDWWTPDLEAASAFADTTVTGRLVLPFNWGEFALWHWGPRLRVSVDGRRETVYSQKTVAIQNAVPVGHPLALAFLEQDRPEYVWLEKRDLLPATTTWLNEHDYRQDVETAQSVIATRGDLPVLRVGTTMGACFP